MKSMIILASVSALALTLGACNGKPDQAKAATADATPEAVAKRPVDDKHTINVYVADCDQNKDCVVQTSFRHNFDPLQPNKEDRAFSGVCKESMKYCSCYDDQFCSVKVTLQVNGRQYAGTVVDVATNGSYASIRLAGARLANQLMGKGAIYAEGETIPVLPGAQVAVTTTKK